MGTRRPRALLPVADQERRRAHPASIRIEIEVTAGQELEWIEDGMGGFRVVPHTPGTIEALAAHEQIMVEYDGVFRALAK